MAGQRGMPINPLFGMETQEGLAVFLRKQGEIYFAGDKKTFSSAWLVRLFETACKLKATKAD